MLGVDISQLFGIENDVLERKDLNASSWVWSIARVCLREAGKTEDRPGLAPAAFTEGSKEEEKEEKEEEEKEEKEEEEKEKTEDDDTQDEEDDVIDDDEEKEKKDEDDDDDEAHADLNAVEADKLDELRSVTLDKTRKKDEDQQQRGKQQTKQYQRVRP